MLLDFGLGRGATAVQAVQHCALFAQDSTRACIRSCIPELVDRKCDVTTAKFARSKLVAASTSVIFHVDLFFLQAPHEYSYRI